MAQEDPTKAHGSTAGVSHYHSEGYLWPGVAALAGAKKGSDVRESVRRWDEAVKRHTAAARAAGRFSGVAPADLNEALFRRGAIARLGGGADGDQHHMRVWAEWVLTGETGASLPAAEDFFGAVKRERHLASVMKTYSANSAEAWAARIEWLSMAQSGPLDLPQVSTGLAEILRLMGYLKGAADVDSELRSDAELGSKFKGRNGQPGRVVAQVAGWLERLPKIQVGERRSNRVAATWIQQNCVDAQDLEVDTIRKYLPKKNV